MVNFGVKVIRRTLFSVNLCALNVTETRRPDPVRDICDLPVKLADLGNACWTVSQKSDSTEVQKA